MRFARSIDLFLDEARRGGRINSQSSERAYRDVLTWHAEDAETTDPRRTTREDVRRTLRRWQHPNTQRNRHSLLASFYRWMVQEGHRRDNPAEQVQRARRRKPDLPRLRQEEAMALLTACETVRERRVIYLGIFAGVRTRSCGGCRAATSNAVG